MVCIANAQLHGFICTWTLNLMEVPYDNTCLFTACTRICLIFRSPESQFD